MKMGRFEVYLNVRIWRWGSYNIGMTRVLRCGPVRFFIKDGNPKMKKLDEIIFATQTEAEEVLQLLHRTVSTHKSASIADLYEIIGAAYNFDDLNWGWTNIHGAGATRVSNGYQLDLPKPEQLE